MNRKIIATLTTIPERLINLRPTLQSILNQTLKPDEIILSIPPKSTRNPKNQKLYLFDIDLITFINGNNIVIRKTKYDYGPATKLLGILERELPLKQEKDKESLIITFDDDKYYDPNTIQVLVDGWKSHPDCVICRKGSCIKYSDKINNILISKVPIKLRNKFNPEIFKVNEQLVIGDNIDEDKYVDMVFGTSGVLYLSSYFENDIFDILNNKDPYPYDIFKFVDDIYISGYLSKKKINKIIPKFCRTEYTKSFKITKFNYNIDRDVGNMNINALKKINSNAYGFINSLRALYLISKVY